MGGNGSESCLAAYSGDLINISHRKFLRLSLFRGNRSGPWLPWPKQHFHIEGRRCLRCEYSMWWTAGAVVVFAAAISYKLLPAAPPLPTVGSVAPDFTLQMHTGASFTLSKVIEERRRVLLWFYPVASTPG